MSPAAFILTACVLRADADVRAISPISVRKDAYAFYGIAKVLTENPGESGAHLIDRCLFANGKPGFRWNGQKYGSHLGIKLNSCPLFDHTPRFLEG